MSRYPVTGVDVDDVGFALTGYVEGGDQPTLHGGYVRYGWDIVNLAGGDKMAFRRLVGEAVVFGGMVMVWGWRGWWQEV